MRLALNWAALRNLAPANPCEGLAEVWRTDRSELIWEPQHLATWLGRIKKQIDKIWRTEKATVVLAGRVRLNHRRRAKIMRLAAARDALLLCCNTGMRREDLAAHAWAERQGPAIVYTARKGARRARTAGRTRRTTIVPVLRTAALIYAHRWEVSGDVNPWVITGPHGGNYTPTALGRLINDLARDYKIDRHLHDGKGTFATSMYVMATKDGRRMFAPSEIAAMVDWSEAEVEAIARRYVGAAAIANAMLARMRRRK